MKLRLTKCRFLILTTVTAEAVLVAPLRPTATLLSAESVPGITVFLGTSIESHSTMNLASEDLGNQILHSRLYQKEMKDLRLTPGKYLTAETAEWFSGPME